MFEIYQDMKKMILNDPGRNFLSLIVLILSLFLPGLLHLCINERELFLLLDPIRVLFYALTFSVPMFAACFAAELYYAVKYLGKASLRECSLLAGIEAYLYLCVMVLMVHWTYAIPLDLLALYLLFMVIGNLACRQSRKKEGRKKAAVIQCKTVESSPEVREHEHHA